MHVPAPEHVASNIGRAATGDASPDAPDLTAFNSQQPLPGALTPVSFSLLQPPPEALEPASYSLLQLFLAWTRDYLLAAHVLRVGRQVNVWDPVMPPWREW